MCVCCEGTIPKELDAATLLLAAPAAPTAVLVVGPGGGAANFIIFLENNFNLTIKIIMSDYIFFLFINLITNFSNLWKILFYFLNVQLFFLS